MIDMSQNHESPWTKLVDRCSSDDNYNPGIRRCQLLQTNSNIRQLLLDFTCEVAKLTAQLALTIACAFKEALASPEWLIFKGKGYSSCRQVERQPAKELSELTSGSHTLFANQLSLLPKLETASHAYLPDDPPSLATFVGWSSRGCCCCCWR